LLMAQGAHPGSIVQPRYRVRPCRFEPIGDHIEFCFEVTHRTGCRWQVWHRFSALQELSKHLALLYPDGHDNLLCFPEQGWWPNFTQHLTQHIDDEFLDNRHAALANYLDAVCQDEELSVHTAVTEILCIKVPEPPAGVRIVNRGSSGVDGRVDLELEVRSRGEPFAPVDDFRVAVVHPQGQRYGTSIPASLETQFAWLRNVPTGEHCFVVTAVNGAGESAIVEVRVCAEMDPNAVPCISDPSSSRQLQQFQRMTEFVRNLQPPLSQHQSEYLRDQTGTPSSNVSAVTSSQELSGAHGAREAPADFADILRERLSGVQRLHDVESESLTPPADPRSSHRPVLVPRTPKSRPRLVPRGRSVADGVTASQERQRQPQQQQLISQSSSFPVVETWRHDRAFRLSPRVSSQNSPLQSSSSLGRILSNETFGSEFLAALPQEESPRLPSEHVDGHRSLPWNQTSACPAARDDTDAGFCAVCLATSPTHAFVPCGHRCVCFPCADTILGASSECPLCRQKATSCLQIYT